MENKVIRTDAGVLELTAPSMDDLRGIARYWPMKLVKIGDDPDRFGLVFQQGDQEVHGVKLQPPDNTESDAWDWLLVNSAWIASALPNYLARGHKGVMVPCAYYKKKGNGTAESGFAFFVGPDAESGSIRSGEESGFTYDDRLGTGATNMIFDMAEAIADVGRRSGQSTQTVIGMDLRPRLALGGLAMYFVVVGPRVFVVKDPLLEDDSVWRHLLRAGFSSLPYAPMTPFALPGS